MPPLRKRPAEVRQFVLTDGELFALLSAACRVAGQATTLEYMEWVQDLLGKLAIHGPVICASDIPKVLARTKLPRASRKVIPLDVEKESGTHA